MTADRALASLVFFAVAACAEVATIPVAAPEDVAWAAIATLDPSGAILESSRLTRWDPNVPFSVYAGADEPAAIFGYTDDQLERAGILAAVEGADPLYLAAASGCAQKLPAPRWAAAWSATGAFEEIDPGSAPPATLREHELACPEVDPALLRFENRCGSMPCRPALLERMRCSFTFGADDCPFEQVKVVFDSNGDVCLELESDNCEPELHTIEPAREPPFSIERIRLFDAAPYFGQHLEMIPLLPAGQSHSGYASDLVIAGEHAVVVASGDQRARPGCTDDAPPKALYVFELETTALVRTATAPRCLERLLATADGAGFYGLFRAPLDWRIARFDLFGRVLVEAEAGIETYLNVKHIARSDDGRLVVLAAGPGGGELATFDPDTLEDRGSVVSPYPLDMHAMTPLGDRAFALVNDGRREVVRADLAADEIAGLTAIPRDTARHATLHDIIHHAPTDRLLVGSMGSADLYVGRFGDELTPVVSWERDLAVTTAVTWPLDQRLILAGALTMGDWRAALVFFDPTAQRFLPGIYELGHGAVGSLIVDRQDRLWVLLPWSAELLKITPDR